MKNILDEIDDFDEKSQRMLLGSRLIQFNEYNKGKDPFEGIRTNKTFQEISNEIAMDSPLGKNSAFYRETREILTGQIPKL